MINLTNVAVRPFPLKPQRMNGLSERLLAVAELRQRGYDARALVGGITAWHAIDGATVPLESATYESET